jgi:hypothetical protein
VARHGLPVQQASLFSILLSGLSSIWKASGFPKAIQMDADIVLANMDNLDTWVLVSEQCADLFKRVMPMALENLSIA